MSEPRPGCPTISPSAPTAAEWPHTAARQPDQGQDLLGHASPATTKTIYAHDEGRKLREVYARASLTAREAAARVRAGL